MPVIAARVPRHAKPHDALLGVSTTGAAVGPNTYDLSRWADGEAEGPGGFGHGDRTSLAVRGRAPGPGAYDMRRSASESALVARPGKMNPLGAGASAFRSRCARISADNLREPLLVPGSDGFLPSTIADNPGPGMYDTRGNLGSRALAAPADERRPRMLAVPEETAPSFRPLRDPDEARYSGKGEVYATWHGSGKDSIGPCDYQQEGHTAMHTAIAREGHTTDFAASGSQRPDVDFKELRSNPAPGAYQMRGGLVKGTSQPFDSEVPQLSTAQPYLTSSCSPSLTPGPGEYSPPAQLRGLEGGEAKPLAFSGLRSTTSRDGWYRPVDQPFTDSDAVAGRVPGPGHYPERKSGFKSMGDMRRARSSTQGFLRQYHGVHTPQQLTLLRDSDGFRSAGFNNSTSRPCLEPTRAPEEADPGTYDRNFSLGQSMTAGLREAVKLGKGGAFGGPKDGDRFRHSPLRGRSEGPAPHDYGHALLPETAIGVRRIDAAGGAFRSQVPQLPPDPLMDRSPKPGPGTYEAPCMASPSGPIVGTLFSPRDAEAHLASGGSRSTSSFHKPKTDHLSFGSSAARTTLFHAKHTTKSVPGPGEYEPRAARRRGGGGAVKTTADRKLDPHPAAHLAEDPEFGRGPGTYEVANGLLRHTFNSSASTPAAAVLLRHAARISEAACAKRAPALEAPCFAAKGGGAGDAMRQTRLAGRRQEQPGQPSSPSEAPQASSPLPAPPEAGEPPAAPPEGE